MLTRISAFAAPCEFGLYKCPYYYYYYYYYYYRFIPSSLGLPYLFHSRQKTYLFQKSFLRNLSNLFGRILRIFRTISGRNYSEKTDFKIKTKT